MVCKNCGAETVEGAKFCTNCGSKLERKVPCKACGRLNDENAKFCAFCGARTDGKKVCATCGTLYEGKFCYNCGASADAPVAVVTQPVAPAKPVEQPKPVVSTQPVEQPKPVEQVVESVVVAETAIAVEATPMATATVAKPTETKPTETKPTRAPIVWTKEKIFSTVVQGVLMLGVLFALIFTFCIGISAEYTGVGKELSKELGGETKTSLFYFFKDAFE